MKVKATVLCDNYVLWNRNALAEHGFSVFLETDAGNYLIDTGSGKTIINNSHALGINLKTVQGILLSHNHWDHTGGLLPVAKIKEGLEAFSHPALFRETFTKEDSLGIPWDRETIECTGMKFNFSADFREIAPGLWLTGEVPRVTEFENDGFRQIVRTENGHEKDNVMDDQSVVIETAKGLVVILGCCHAGLINTLSQIAKKMNSRRFYAVIGGTHLAPASDEKKAKVFRALDDFEFERFGISHCSGLEIIPPLAEKYGTRFSYFGVGAVLEA